jgi:hypothetical protein
MTSRLVFVPLEAPYADHKYGFRTTLESAKGTVLGHQTLDATTPVTGLIFKANHPKPKRASKTFATGTASSYIAPSAVAGAIAAGWDVSRARSNGYKSNSRFQIAVYVTVNGVKYAWAMRKSQKAKLGANFGVLGIKEVTGTEQDLVFGASFPKPPRAGSITVSGKGATATTLRSFTYFDPSNEASLPAEFAKPKGRNSGQTTSADWSNFV